MNSTKALVKRIFDIVLTLLLLVLFSPLLLLIFFVLFIEHMFRGQFFKPMFYKEIRFSNGKPFTLIKFNIFKQSIVERMRKNNEFIHTKDLEHQGALTFVGYILKQIYLDELPQLFCVLSGSMSLVGPRPLNKEVYEGLPKEDREVKDALRAGMTGYFQSQKGFGSQSSSELDKAYLDFYMNNPTYKIILFDMKIIFLRTVKVLLQAKGV